MMPGVALIIQPVMDLNTLLPLSRQLLGYSPAKAADGTTVPLPELAHQLACLAAFGDEKAPPTIKAARIYLGMLSVGFLVAADTIDMLDILEAARGLESVVTETTQRNTHAAIIAGPLDKWQRAITLACQLTLQNSVRHTYNEMYRQLSNAGLRSIFGDLRVVDQSDKTFLLLEG